MGSPDRGKKHLADRGTGVGWRGQAEGRITYPNFILFPPVSCLSLHWRSQGKTRGQRTSLKYFTEVTHLGQRTGWK